MLRRWAAVPSRCRSRRLGLRAVSRRGLRAVTVAAVAVLLGVIFAPRAQAGFGISPNGVTTSKPTFTVYLEPSELYTAEVYVTTDGQYDSNYYPLHQVGDCFSFTPTGNENAYTCQPIYYSTSASPDSTSLPPGTYYWWLRFYHQDPGSYFSSVHISGPIQITVPQAVAPPGAGPVSPFDGATVSTTTPTLRIHATASSSYHIYVSSSSQHNRDGSPLLDTAYHCSGAASVDSDYICTVDQYALQQGHTYYWWMTLAVGDNGWIYTARQLTISSPPPSGGGGSGGGGGGGGSSGPHTEADAPLLPTSAHFTGASIHDSRLSQASYGLSKYVGAPKMVAVACWSDADWSNIGGDANDGLFSTLAFWDPLWPHWIQLSPGICRGIETLLYHRPASPNAALADSVETATHEMMHALGVTRQRFGMTAEAIAECYGMQLSVVMANDLGVPWSFNKKLARLNLINYAFRPPAYRNIYACREGGTWDLFPKEPSPPWHDFPGG
jgi:hypothetical protein